MSFASSNNVRSSDGPSRLSRLPIKIPGRSSRSRSSCQVSQIPQKKSIDKNTTRSKSTSGDPLRLSRQRSASLLKQTTPLTHNIRSARKSPLLTSTRKDNRPISDKRWQQEQLVNIKEFIELYLPEVDPRNIKSGMSLDCFIILSGRLFEMIDKRLIITKENYIEEIPTILKLLNYPTTIKPSLMKSVNTPHSWSSVVAIFSWLIDIIYKSNIKNTEQSLLNIVDNCVMKLFWSLMDNRDNTNIDEYFKEMDAKLVEFFDINEDDLESEENEIKLLKARKLECMEKTKKNCEEIEILKNKLELINNKCNQYKSASDDFEHQLLEKQELVTQNTKKLSEELEKLCLVQDDLKNKIANQPHTLAEKKLLMSEIEALRNTVKLKEERCQQQSTLIHTIDHQLSDLSQKLQADAYNYNNIVSQLELNDSSLKELHIRESGFMQSDTEDKLRNVEKLLRIENNKAKDKTKLMEVQYQELAHKYKFILEEIITVSKELEELVKINAELEYSTEQKNMKATRERQSALNQLNVLRSQLMELKSNRPKIEDLEQILLELGKEHAAAAEAKSDLQSKAFEFFVSLDMQISDSIEVYTKMMVGLSEHFISTNRILIDDSKARVESCEAGNKEIEELKNQKKK